jgi:hypothetical protein
MMIVHAAKLLYAWDCLEDNPSLQTIKYRLRMSEPTTKKFLLAFWQGVLESAGRKVSSAQAAHATPRIDGW